MSPWQTPYVDLFQLHWPDRYCPGFGANAYDPSKAGPGNMIPCLRIGLVDAVLRHG